MSNGIRITNPSTGHIQIDGTYYNLALREKGTYRVADNPYSGPNSGSVTLDMSSEGVLAIRSDLVAIIKDEYLGSGKRRFTFYSPAYDRPTVTYYVFDRPQYGISDGASHGIIVRNSSGGITFDSRLRYMNVIRVDNNVTVDSDISVSGYGTNFAVVLGGSPKRLQISSLVGGGGPYPQYFNNSIIYGIETGSSKYKMSPIQDQYPASNSATAISYRSGQISNMLIDISKL